MAAQFQLTMRSGPTPGKAFPLEAVEITVGRDTSNGISINDAEISRKHAKLTLQGSVYVLEDLGSTNGTFVNGTRLGGPFNLKTGDTISFGENVAFLYEAGFDPNATMAAPPKAAKPASPVQPAPAPVPSAPPAYSGQVPAGPAPMPASPKEKRKFPVWLIIVIILVLLVICLCGGFFIIIDQLKLWCKVVPFLVPLLGGTC